MKAKILLTFLTLFMSVPVLAERTHLMVFAHRGGRAHFPESSVAAFNYSLHLGVEYLDTDLHVTRDNVVVLSHDAEINPELCLGPGGQKMLKIKKVMVRSLTLAELKKYDCGSLFYPLFPKQEKVPGTRFLTLAELFELVDSSSLPIAKTVKFNLEIKAQPWESKPSTDDYAKMVLEIIRQYGMQNRVIVESMNPLYSKKYNELAPQYGVAQLAVFFPMTSWVNPLVVSLAHWAGEKVVPWTPNTPKAWGMLIASGVDGIITDDPAGLIEYLKSRGLR